MMTLAPGKVCDVNYMQCWHVQVSFLKKGSLNSL